jgi:hypothetical protein
VSFPDWIRRSTRPSPARRRRKNAGSATSTASTSRVAQPSSTASARARDGLSRSCRRGHAGAAGRGGAGAWTRGSWRRRRSTHVPPLARRFGETGQEGWQPDRVGGIYRLEGRADGLVAVVFTHLSFPARGERIRDHYALLTQRVLYEMFQRTEERLLFCFCLVPAASRSSRWWLGRGSQRRHGDPWPQSLPPPTPRRHMMLICCYSFPSLFANAVHKASECVCVGGFMPHTSAVCTSLPIKPKDLTKCGPVHVNPREPKPDVHCRRAVNDRIPCGPDAYICSESKAEGPQLAHAWMQMD